MRELSQQEGQEDGNFQWVHFRHYMAHLEKYGQCLSQYIYYNPVGLRKSSEVALLNANYMLRRLKDHYNIKFVNDAGLCAHEFIMDCSEFQKFGIEVTDIAKRLMDYGFHSPTMSWPVPSSLMLEPTESESLEECDRLCNALIQIRQEIDKVANGDWDRNINPLKLAPHTIEVVTADIWDRPYSRLEAAFPTQLNRNRDALSSNMGRTPRPPFELMNSKIWPAVGRLDDAYGDVHLVCSCAGLEDTSTFN